MDSNTVCCNSSKSLCLQLPFNTYFGFAWKKWLLIYKFPYFLPILDSICHTVKTKIQFKNEAVKIHLILPPEKHFSDIGILSKF